MFNARFKYDAVSLIGNWLFFFIEKQYKDSSILQINPLLEPMETKFGYINALQGVVVAGILNKMQSAVWPAELLRNFIFDFYVVQTDGFLCILGMLYPIWALPMEYTIQLLYMHSLMIFNGLTIAKSFTADVAAAIKSYLQEILLQYLWCQLWIIFCESVNNSKFSIWENLSKYQS